MYMQYLAITWTTAEHHWKHYIRIEASTVLDGFAVGFKTYLGIVCLIFSFYALYVFAKEKD